MIVRDIEEVMEEIAPLSLAAEWDNVGLLLGEREARVSRILLTIDLTETVVDEAIAAKASLILAYHPPIFSPLSSLTDREPKERIVLKAARAGVAIYSPHTALDAAPGGVNDWLAEGLGPGDIRALDAHADLPATEQTKVVTFCPADAVDRLRNALAATGAGRIGEYELCSFELRGTGTFFGHEGTDPSVGQRGRLERVQEVRLEMVCPRRSLPLAVMSIRQFHPYEEPPIEIYPLEARPLRHVGQGRRLTLDRAASLRTIVDRARKTIGAKRLLAAVAESAPRRHQMIGICAGAGGSLLGRAIEEGCTLFFTGEMRHHDVLDARARGCTVLLAGHTNTERGYLRILARRLTERLPDAKVSVSRKDADPLRVV